MSKRITWQNVEGPDFRGAIYAQGQAADLFDRAAKTIGGTLTGINDQNIKDENLAAIAKASQVQDISEFDRIMKQSGIAGFGIGEGRANEALLNFVNSRRDDLESNRQTELDYNQDQFQFGREKILAGRNDEKYAKEQAALELDLKAGQIANDMARQGFSAEEVQREVLNKYGNDQVMQQAVLKHLSAQPDGRYTSLSSTKVDEGSAGALSIGRDLLGSEEFSVQETIGSSEGLKLVTQANERFEGGAGGLKKLTSSLGEFKSSASGIGEGESKVDLEVGEVRREFQKLKNDFPNVPDSMIMMAMEESLTSTGVGWIANGDLTTDLGGARDLLTKVATEADRAGFLEVSQDIQKRNQQISTYRADLDKAENDLKLAIDRNDPAQVAKAQQRVITLSNKITKAYGKSAGTGNNPSEADILARVNQTLSAVGGNVGGSEAAPTENQANAARINETAAPLVRGAQTGLSNLNQSLDQFLGTTAAVVPQAGGVATNLLGGAVSAFSPERGAALLDSADRAFQTADRLRTEGFVPGGTDFSAFSELFRGNGNNNSNDNGNGNGNARPQPTQNQAQTLPEIERVITSGALPPEVNIQAEVILNAIKTGLAPGTGEPLNANALEMLEQRLRQLVQNGR